MSQPAVSRHLRVLREAGLVRVRVDAQRRLYRIEAAPLRAVDDWLGCPTGGCGPPGWTRSGGHLDAMDDEPTEQTTEQTDQADD